MPRYQYKYRKPQKRKTRPLRVVLVILLLLLLAYPFFEAFHINVEEHTTNLKSLPSALRNLKIVYLSDIHQNLWDSQARTDKIVKMVNSLSADLVLLGGDYASDPDSAIAFFENLPLIQARLGAFGVLGNKDSSESSLDERNLTQAMKDAGVTPLVNEVAQIKVGQATLYIAGVGDLQSGRTDLEAVASQVSADDFVILLGHSPDILSYAVDYVDKNGKTHWFDLGLFGHTHGGQVTLFGQPLLGAFKPLTSTRYLSGWITENRAEILISNGVGTSNLPIRLFAPAQIHLIRLR